MKVKVLFMAALLALGVTTASAQSEGEFRIGVTAGMNVSNISDQNTDCRIGFNVGVRGEYNFTNNFYGNIGLLFSQKGTRTDSEGSLLGFSAKGTVTQNPGYLEIPVQLGYRFNMGNGVSIFGETGPYFAFGVCGKNKIDAETSLTSNSYDYDFFGDNAAKTFDCGWGLRAGVEVSSFQISLGYEHGITKLYDGDNSCRNSNFMVGLAYMF